MHPKIENTQPLYVQDFANDKAGLVVNNKGEVKRYTNVGINEQIEEVCDDCGAMQMDEGEHYDWWNNLSSKEKSKLMSHHHPNKENDSNLSNNDIKRMYDDIYIKDKFRPGFDLGKSFEKFKRTMEMMNRMKIIK